MTKKRGQFYIVAAVIIVVVLVSLTSITTYISIKSNPETIYDLGEELSLEGFRVVEYGIYNQENVTQIVEDLTNETFFPYFSQKMSEADIGFIYGNKTDIYGVVYNRTEGGTISASLGETLSEIQYKKYVKLKKRLENTGGETRLSVFDKNYTFEISEGEVFYFLIVQEKEGEVYIERN
ncbi:hypothetical protein GF386_05165 [Candidatus Pacearchaeota archaeon]|nr:hypothetical protein [Candidatus Pacearchaeota archaeon]MBD3283501.1 hypothetical protein [Candidatus Pacearchaeota archaeon]